MNKEESPVPICLPDYPGHLFLIYQKLPITGAEGIDTLQHADVSKCRFFIMISILTCNPFEDCLAKIVVLSLLGKHVINSGVGQKKRKIFTGSGLDAVWY